MLAGEEVGVGWEGEDWDRRKTAGASGGGKDLIEHILELMDAVETIL